MHVVGVGTFTFEDAAHEVVAYPEADVDADLVTDAYRRTVLPLALQALGSEVLHASAVRTPSGVVALCGVSGTGKSTIALALSRRGYPLWADDAVELRIDGAAVDALPLPFRLRLKNESLAHFGGGAPTELVEPEAGVLSAVVVLERGTDVTLRAVDAAEAFTLVLTHAYCFDLDEEQRKREMTDTYLRLCTLVPIYAATVPEGFGQLDEISDAIARATA